MSNHDAVTYDYGRWGMPWRPAPTWQPEQAPVILIPTPEQRAAGVRVVPPESDQVPNGCARVISQLSDSGYLHKLGRALAMLPPKWQGARHEQPKRLETIGLRIWSPSIELRAFARWDNGKSAGALLLDEQRRMRQLGITELVKLLIQSAANVSRETSVS